MAHSPIWFDMAVSLSALWGMAIVGIRLRAWWLERMIMGRVQTHCYERPLTPACFDTDGRAGPPALDRPGPFGRRPPAVLRPRFDLGTGQDRLAA